MMKKSLLLFVIIAVYLPLISCINPNAKWQNGVGTYNYDSAVVELGPPDDSRTISNGDLVCSWTTSIGRNWIDKIILTFDRNKVLKSGFEKRF
jgi:hypothetical protein